MKKFLVLFLATVFAAAAMAACGRPSGKGEEGQKPQPTPDASIGDNTPPSASDNGVPDMGTPDNGPGVPDMSTPDVSEPDMGMDNTPVPDNGVPDAGQLDNPPVCVPSCTDKVCGGMDGCGGKCVGACGANEACNPSTYACECVPQCGNKQCGDDGCGGVCGVCVSKPCVAGECKAGQCVFSSMICDDSNPKTNDSCDPATGACVHEPKACDDKDACTTDSLDDAGNCVYSEKLCDDKNACTGDYCEPLEGCLHSDAECKDGDPCTTDSCDPAKGCIFAPKVCDDGNPCTDDVCDQTKGCVSTQKVCDDSNPCTVDSCNPATGKCEFAHKSCDDGLDYTTDSCNPATGACEFAVKAGTCLKDTDCSDGNSCTEDVCDSITHQCKLVEVVCNDGNPCTTETCHPAGLGIYGYECRPQYKDCKDGNACTSDYCDPATGGCVHEAVLGCCLADADCADSSACVVGWCENLGCPKSPECFGGAAVNHECQSWPLASGAQCTGGACDGQGHCIPTPECATAADCIQSNYTEEFCVSGVCKYTDTQFSVQCRSEVGAQWPACACEVWVGFGGWEKVDDLSCLKINSSDFGQGVKKSSKEICNSWWDNYDDPTGARDSASVEVNARVVCADSTEWIGGQFVQMVAPDGALVPLVVLHQSAKGVGWKDANGVWHGLNYGTQQGIPWCEGNLPTPNPCE